jgi:hypothetical protein
MKTIQGMLAQYFIMKSETEIEFVSSMNKLKQFEGRRNITKPLENTLIQDASMNNPASITNPDYKQHKKDGIYYCRQMIEKNKELEHWLPALDTKKKDDLADCFLQGIWYLKNRNIITFADDLKINIVRLS